MTKSSTDLQNQIEFISILLSQAYHNTHTTLSFQKWQEKLYNQILIELKKQKSCEEETQESKDVEHDETTEKEEKTLEEVTPCLEVESDSNPL